MTRWNHAAGHSLSLILIIMLSLLYYAACRSSRESQINLTACGTKLTAEVIGSFVDGFCGNDAYRVRAEYVPGKTGTGPGMGKEKAMQNAVTLARMRMIEKFRGMCSEQWAMAPHGDEKSGAMKAWKKSSRLRELWFDELKKIIPEGTVIATAWRNNGTCVIIYELRMPGLRKRSERCR